ncbi:MAG: amino acid permease [Acidobacteriota bacterium]|jgi:amino acid transporter|nr:amino acid permease [Acidobacteriota bacterium]
MKEEKLIRGIGRWDLTAIVINTVIGAGIFGLPSKVAALIGSYSIIAFIVCSIIIVFVVLCFAEVSSRFQTTGGAYIYTKEAYGNLVGFEVGWLFWLTRFTAFAANCNLLVDYLGYFNESLAQGTLRIFIIALVVFGLTAINIVGVKQTVTATNILTFAKLTPLFLFVIVGMFFIQPVNFDFGISPTADVFANAILVLIYAFVGFESAVIPAGEMENPKKNAPFALMTAIGIIVALYILIQIVSIGTLPELANSERPLADAAENFVGTFGATFIVIGALVSILGNLNVGLLSTTRLLFAMAEQKDVPQFLAKVSDKFKTPHIAIILTSIGIFIYTISSSFIAALTISTITRLIVYAMTCVALPIFRYRKDAPEAGVIVPLGILASIFSLILIGWLLLSVKLLDLYQLLIFIVIGLVFYFLYKYLGKKDSGDLS